MRRISAFIISALLLGALAAQFTSCEQYVLPAVSISTDTLRFGPGADSASFTVTTNVITTVEPEGLWASANPAYIEGVTTSVMIRVRENTGNEARSTKVSVKSEAIQRDLTVVQDRPVPKE
ncbi:MAG: hypothetical protein K6G79_03830 [Bacteroidales bacterium]|nr:hypothetical protein [Bacteroidales bacterium]